MFSYDVILILVFLLPGFLALAILNIFLVRKNAELSSQIIEALIFTIIIYAFYSIWFDSLPITLSNEDKANISINIQQIQTLVLICISCIFPIIISLFVNNDIHMKIARYFKVSSKTARLNVWQDVFCTKRRYLILHFANGRRLFGWPEYYPDLPEEQYLYLKEPAWVNDNNEFMQLTELDGILITPSQEIEMIEFFKSSDSKTGGNANG
jgi:hypothetical protein